MEDSSSPDLRRKKGGNVVKAPVDMPTAGRKRRANVVYDVAQN